MKFKKYFKVKYNQNLIAYDKLYFGFIGLKTLSHVNLTSDHIKIGTRFIKRIVKKKNFLLTRALPFRFITRKPRDVRMGRGKGNPSIKIFPLKAGSIIFELRRVPVKLAVRALKFCSLRMPSKTLIIEKNDKSTNYFKSN